jgi:hypothetical protein
MLAMAALDRRDQGLRDARGMRDVDLSLPARASDDTQRTAWSEGIPAGILTEAPYRALMRAETGTEPAPTVRAPTDVRSAGRRASVCRLPLETRRRRRPGYRPRGRAASSLSVM